MVCKKLFVILLLFILLEKSKNDKMVVFSGVSKSHKNLDLDNLNVSMIFIFYIRFYYILNVR